MENYKSKSFDPWGQAPTPIELHLFVALFLIPLRNFAVKYQSIVRKDEMPFMDLEPPNNPSTANAFSLSSVGPRGPRVGR